MLPAPLSLRRDRFLGLLLRAHEEDRVAAANRLAHELEGVIQAGDRLGEVDDVDPVALSEDEVAHLWVPASRLVAEVDASLKQLLHADGSQGYSSGSFLRSPQLPSVDPSA